MVDLTPDEQIQAKEQMQQNMQQMAPRLVQLAQVDSVIRACLPMYLLGGISYMYFLEKVIEFMYEARQAVDYEEYASHIASKQGIVQGKPRVLLVWDSKKKNEVEVENER